MGLIRINRVEKTFTSLEEKNYLDEGKLVVKLDWVKIIIN